MSDWYDDNDDNWSPEDIEDHHLYGPPEWHEQIKPEDASAIANIIAEDMARAMKERVEQEFGKDGQLNYLFTPKHAPMEPCAWDFKQPNCRCTITRPMDRAKFIFEPMKSWEQQGMTIHG